jgi:hypothetical protein
MAVFKMLLKKNRFVLLPAVFLILLLSACPFNPPNKVPVWFLPIGDQIVEETKTLEILLTDHISDEDGDILSFSVTGKGSVVGALYSYTPGIGESAIEFEEEAVYPVTITADDGKGGTASESFNVTVMSTNRPPNWITIPNKTVQEGSTLTVLLTTYASDPDGDVLTFDILEGPGEINGNNYEYSPSYEEAAVRFEEAAVYSVVLRAVDSKGAEATTSFSVTVTNSNRVPVLSIPSPQYVTAGTTLSLDISTFASDPDGDSLTFSKVAGVGAVAGSTFTYSPLLSDSGTRNATIRANDGNGGQTDQTFDIIINPSGINNPPNTPSNPNPASGALTQPANLTLSWIGGDPDGDAVTYDVYFGTSPTSLVFKTNRSTTTYPTGALSSSTYYYWRIVAIDSKGATKTGPVWSFRTAPTKAFEETFETYSTGTITGSFGKWHYIESGSVPNPFITTISSHGKVIGFYGGTGGYSVVYTSSVKPIKLGYLEYDIRLSSSTAPKWGWIAPNNTNAFTGIGYLGGSQAIICWTNSGGSYHSEKVMNISPGVWYKVKVVFNHTTGNAAVYVDGTYKRSFVYGTVSAGTNGVRMTTSNSFLSYIMFDNISLWATDAGYVP